MTAITISEQDAMRHVSSRDLEVRMSAAFIIRSNYGSLIALRGQLEKLFKRDLIYPTISSSPLFVVHWNDLSEKKQQEIGRGKRE